MNSIDPSHEPHNAFDKYPTMHHLVTEMCTFLLQNGALWGVELVHYGICATSLLFKIITLHHADGERCIVFTTVATATESPSREKRFFQFRLLIDFYLVVF